MLRVIPAVEVLGEGLEPLDGLGLEPAVGEFLNPVGEAAFEEAAVIRRWLRSEELAPLLFQIGGWRRLQRR
jgi:hypothetical protein